MLGRPRISAEIERAVSESLRAGTGIRKVAARHGVGVGTVQRIAAGA
jgi:transposase